MDHILVVGLRELGVHGVLPEERTRAQPFEVDRERAGALVAAGASDALDDTVDYGTLSEQVRAIVSGESCLLIERLAARIAEAALADPRVIEATVTVKKLRPPVPVQLDHVAVRITRARS
jgi:dihydroneopterin aldolase